jgi:hypothetical protein
MTAAHGSGSTTAAQYGGSDRRSGVADGEALRRSIMVFLNALGILSIDYKYILPITRMWCSLITPLRNVLTRYTNRVLPALNKDVLTPQ